MLHKLNDQNGKKGSSKVAFDHSVLSTFRGNDDDDEDFMNDDPGFDDTDQENKENAVELGMRKYSKSKDMFVRLIQ